MPPFERHLFICTNERAAGHPRGCCATKNSFALKDYFKAELKRRGFNTKIRANAAGCLDACELGPAVVVYPEAVWYQVKNEADALEIIEKHLTRPKDCAEIVQRLAIFSKAS